MEKCGLCPAHKKLPEDDLDKRGDGLCKAVEAQVREVGSIDIAFPEVLSATFVEGVKEEDAKVAVGTAFLAGLTQIIGFLH